MIVEFGGAEGEWKKLKGQGLIEVGEKNEDVELHWYEEVSVGKVKMKVKEKE